MKIVILDAYTANPGDLDWQVFKDLGQLQTYDRTSVDAVIENAAEAEIAVSYTHLTLPTKA